ncbi:MarR family transcriptional regulator [Candidatus Parcubacteria bacterium]|uniref:MarR family transcriptional regulator n=1 Tax=Candidatus Kaiserbacteria bacterium CG10_big_fil_rev_8_21_14_0_10_47_16 TaxID=1974608 RepID=A0A2H0UEH0_9BACT|nr:MarR family transcriptional regulator [Candidatus Parcubacteria bacterium]PIR84787.1 MAG: MarR family transcriptional regulator [Candidatus Kaiserbacteria bacterium CG10_big_fil_rev_8_21_14_0_10_47_16]
MNKEVAVVRGPPSLSLEGVRRVIAACPEEIGTLTLRQLEIILFLKLQNTCEENRTVRAIAAALNMTKSVVSRALDTLEDCKFVRRRKDLNDGRSVFVDVLPRGEAFLAEI